MNPVRWRCCLLPITYIWYITPIMRERIGFGAKGVVCLPSHSGALQRVSRSASLHESAANAEDVALGSKNLLEAERAFCD